MNNHFCNLYVDDKEKTIQVPNGGFSKSEVLENDMNVIVLETGDMRDLNLSESAKAMFERNHRNRIRLTRFNKDLEK